MPTERLSPEDYRAYKPKKKAKYRSLKAEVDGHKFHSRKEAKRYGELNALLMAGEIHCLAMQVPYEVYVKQKMVCKWVADFVYLVYDGKTKKQIVEDVKGFRTPLYKLKKKLVEAFYDIEILEK